MQKLIISLFLVLLMGCSHIYGDRGVIKNHETDYLKAQAIPPLKMPPGYSDTTIKNHYPVPQEQGADPSKERIVLTPPELNSSSQ